MTTVQDRQPSPVDQSLGALLVQDGTLSPAQLLAVQQHAWHHNLDLRQALLQLRLVAPDRLEQLVKDRVHFTMPAKDSSGAHSTGTVTGPHFAVQAEPKETRTEPVSEPPPTKPVPVTKDTGSVADTPPPLDRAKQSRDFKNELKEIAETAGPIDLVTQIFERAYESRATDIHFDPQDDSLRIRFRIDGQLHDVLEIEHNMGVSVVSRLKVIGNLNIIERRHAQDGRITIRYKERNCDLRIATLPMISGEKVVVRLHEALTEASNFEQLGMNKDECALLESLCAKPYGAVLVAGPVGAGKTTTLYSCISRVNVPSRNLMTIEDPIEHRMPGVNQLQIDSRAELGFAAGLKAMLRQDPNVIMIGEIRDDETAHIGIRAAMTGVLVFSTIHASDAPSTIGNLYDFKIPGYLLSNTLLGIVSQRLLRKICPYCREAFSPDDRTYSLLGVKATDHPDLVLYRGRGCPACFQTGYLGRTGIFEIMEIGEVLRELVFQQISKDVLRRVAIDLGMRTLRQSAVDKVIDGSTTVEEIYRVVAM